MNILIISHMFPNNRNPVHGIFVSKQAEALAKLGHDVTVVSPIPWTPWPLPLLKKGWAALAETPSCERVNSLLVYRPRYIAFPRALLFCSSGDRMRSSLTKFFHRELDTRTFDIVHSHVGIPDGYAGLDLARKLQCPHFVTVHGQDFHLTAGKSRACHDKLHYVLVSSNRVITVSSKLARLGREIYPDIADSISVVPNGINAAEIEDARKHPVPREATRTLIVSASNLVSTKGIDINLRAIARLARHTRNITYLVIGDGPERRKLEKLAQKLGIASFVHFLGRLDHHETLRHIASADIFSLPSWKEGFGVVYLEAMALGKPVIACAGEGPEDFITDGKTGYLVPPNDVESTARLLDKLIADENMRASVGLRASQLVFQRFTWINVGTQLEALYKEAIDELKTR